VLLVFRPFHAFFPLFSQKLFTVSDNFRSLKALIAANYSSAPVEVSELALGKQNRNPEFLKKFPLAKVPALETPNGDTVFESNAIAYYLANNDLKGQSDIDKAHVLQWLSFADNELLPAACAWVFPALGLMRYKSPRVESAKEEVKHLLGVLNDHLLTKTYLVGERISLADIVVWCTLLNLYKHVLEPSYRESFVNLNRWFNTLLHQSEFKAVVGDVKLCEKEAQAESKKEDVKKDKKEKKKEAKKEGKKEEKKKEKAEKVPKAKEENAGDEPEEEELPELQQKSKDPFEEFPKGNFNMDDFKRFYSNNPEDQSIPYFWEKFDKENYSIWYCEYLYPQELTLVFMSCNLITGMFQRLDKMRKNAFGSMILFGEDNNSSISGVWVWRGPELAFKLSPDWQVDYESYSWKKLDPDSEETKKLVKEYFSWEGEFGGKKFNQGKIFK
ncbi:elongation factor-1 gamma-like protein, partial [Dinothrombium tinctorium]